MIIEWARAIAIMLGSFALLWAMVVRPLIVKTKAVMTESVNRRLDSLVVDQGRQDAAYERNRAHEDSLLKEIDHRVDVVIGLVGAAGSVGAAGTTSHRP